MYEMIHAQPQLKHVNITSIKICNGHYISLNNILIIYQVEKNIKHVRSGCAFALSFTTLAPYINHSCHDTKILSLQRRGTGSNHILHKTSRSRCWNSRLLVPWSWLCKTCTQIHNDVALNPWHSMSWRRLRSNANSLHGVAANKSILK